MKALCKVFLSGMAVLMSLPVWGRDELAGSSTPLARGAESSMPSVKIVSKWQSGVPAVSTATGSAVADRIMKAPSLTSLRINGMLMYDDNRSEDVLGFYEYTVTAPVARRALTLVPRQTVGGDAVVYDGKLYTYHLDESYGFVNSAYYTEIDVATGTATKSSNISYELGPAYSHYATSAAVNPVDGKVYCSGYEYNTSDKTLTPVLKLWDLAGRSKTAIGTMEAPLAVMSFDKDGNLYGITSCSSRGSADGGHLVKVDTATGTLTVVGDTGIRPWFDQSGVISPYDGKLYWFANEPMEGNDMNAARAILYTVDLASATTTAVGYLPNGDEVVAAWIPSQSVSDNAPGVVTGLKADFTAPSLKGNIIFNLPAESYSGGELSGTVAWKVVSAGNVLAEGSGNAGEEVTAPVEVAASGVYTFDVSASNDNGTGSVIQIEEYIGYGVPAAASDVKFAIEDNVNTITWTHSTGLVGKGYMEGEYPAYRIVRQPGNVLLQEEWTSNSFTEPALDGELQSTYYEVTPVNGDVAGQTVRSNTLVTGSSIALPYSEDFTDMSSFDLFTTIDANKDNSTWYYSVKSAKIRQTTSGDQDDWLVLPPVRLEKGYSYDLKFNCYALTVTSVNILDIAMGESPENMTETLVSNLEVTDTKSTAMKEVAVTIKPKASATYRIGIHIKSASRQGTFTVDDITLSAGTSTAIPAAPELNVEAGEAGALSARLLFAAPVLTAGGDKLENAVTSFEIERDGQLIATVNAENGKTDYVYTDAEVPAAGTYTYSVRALNADGKGETATAYLFIGCDTPQAPSGFTAVDNYDGTVTLSWDAPLSTGVNGGYVAIDRLVYAVTAPDGTVTDGITGTGAEATIDKVGPQTVVSFTLGVRYSDDPVSAARNAVSNTLVVGAPYRLPFAESFPVEDEIIGASTAIWTKEVVEGKSSSVTLSMRADADHGGNGGGLHFTSYSSDVVARWCSPVIDLSAAVDPTVSLWVKIPNGNVNFELQVCKEYGDWQTIATVDEATDWTEVKTVLEGVKSNHVRLGMLIRSLNSFNYTYVDDISVTDATSGIGEVMDNNDLPVEIYTIQGLRVNDMLSSGLYIVRKGKNVRKILVP